MSVYRQMLGRGLPCGLPELLGPVGGEAPPAQHERLTLGVRSDPHGAALRIGREHLAAGQWAEVVRWLGAVDPEHMPAWGPLAMAVACERLGRHGEAARHLDAALSPRGGGEAAVTDLYRGFCAAGLAYERGSNREEATARYRTALLHRPDGELAAWRLTALHLATGRYAEAAFHLHDLLIHHPSDQTARICLGHLLELAGRHREAAWQYEAAVRMSPGGATSFPRMRAAAECRAGESRPMEQLATATCRGPAAHMRLGDYHSARGDAAAASAHYRRAIELYPDYLECRLAMARHEMRLSRPEAAADHLRDALAINSQHVELYAGLALTRHSERDTTEALELLASASRIARGGAVLEAELEFAREGRAARQAGSPLEQRIDDLMARDAAAVAQNAFRLAPRLRLARLLRLRGRTAQAVDVLRECLRIDPWWTDAWLELASGLHELARYDDAWAAVRSALDPDARAAVLFYRLALARCDTLEWNLAVEKAASPRDGDDRRLVMLDLIQSMRLGRRQADTIRHTGTGRREGMRGTD